VDVHEIDAGMMHAHQQHAGRRFRHRCIDALQDFGAAVLADLDAFHGRDFLERTELSRIRPRHPLRPFKD
jgi:hypothetical protein